MPRNGKKNLAFEEKVKIALDMKTTRKSITMIAIEMDRSPATVSTIKYESLTDEERAAVEAFRLDPKLLAVLHNIAGKSLTEINLS